MTISAMQTLFSAALHISRMKTPERERRAPIKRRQMKRVHEAAAHDRWFRAQVAESLREADDPATAMIAHERVMAEMKAAVDRLAGKKSRRRAR